MGKEAEFGTKMRLLQVMKSILDRPFGYTKRELAVRHGCHKDTIKKDFETFNNAGLLLKYDDKHRYAFVQEGAYKALQELSHFSDNEKKLLEDAIDLAPKEAIDYQKGEQLKRKLNSLYDYGQLGLAHLRIPYLRKVDLLRLAEKGKKRVMLIDYPSSNSNVVKDRYVEPFHVSTPDDMVHVIDVNQKELRHFRISRIKRVKLLDETWEYENLHIIRRTDPFRIVDENQQLVRLHMNVGAKNELLERFPLTRNHIEAAAEDNTYYFQCMVNHKFLGLTNFILGHYYQSIEVLGPDSLLEHLRNTVEKMKF